ncbi:SRPBCC family protein [Reyranella sp. CPCC 100927]|uniref:SRPBCC family protein n=1 Tax=Reyranella sp. CPCC 100927 TaxID=2599616 RepID=UPI0011B37347|nr:SRPBCC family protein [Reyranella sp. CPCC 100927]TWT01260.1 zinc-binding dehydrogenase [Reyranella sp. CPCC 100927]
MIRVTRSAIIDAPIERVWAVLRDFNSHAAWHPAVAQSAIENDEPSDQVGCVRSFSLRDGNQIREQLLALSDAEHVSTYCILDATLPMRRYVATLQLKRVTDGERTFWHWQSTFDVPKGREREFTDLVGKGVYEGGFEGLRTFLRRRPGAPLVRATGGPALATQGIVATRFGGADVLEMRPLEVRPPGPGEVRVRHTAIGVNYIDVYVRKGQYRLIEPPAPLGMEAAGEVLEVGDGVGHLLPGDRIAYACAPPGAYVGVRTVAADQVVVLPDHVDDETAAALMLKGMTAEYLLHRTHRLRAGETVLVHAAAGGVGLLLCQWAKALGARVIGTTSSDDKARSARASGCDFVIVGRDYRFAQAVHDVTSGRGADVIYDGLGVQAARENLDALAPCGHWVSYGQASGPLERLSIDSLSEKSATFSRPVLFHHTADRTVLTAMADRVFDALRSGILRPDIRHRYALGAAAQAHRDLESRTTSGPLILLP